MKGKKRSADHLVTLFSSSPKERVRIFKRLLQHIERGLSADCFTEFCEQQIYENMEKYPLEWPRKDFVESTRKAKAMWEDIGYRQSNGSCVGNSRSWYYNMANRYGWSEKQKLEASHEGTVNVNIVNYSKPTQS